PWVVSNTVVEFYNYLLDHYFITVSSAEQASIDAGGSGPGWTRTGKMFTSGGTKLACRFYGPGPKSHFYTIDADECASAMLDPDWTCESYAFSVIAAPTAGPCPAGTIPVHRLYNNRYMYNDSNHRYVTSAAIYQQMIEVGWKGEGVVFCASS